MSKIHKVGDICIGQNLEFDSRYNNMECVIIEGQEWCEWKNEDGSSGSCVAYLVRWEDDAETIQSHLEFRATKPPAEDDVRTVSWENAGWSPNKFYA